MGLGKMPELTDHLTTKIQKRDMKPIQTLICIMTLGTMIFATGKASASLGVVNVSATALNQTDSNPSPGVFFQKTSKAALNTKGVLQLLSNATGLGWFTDKGSQLVYDPDAFNAFATSNYAYNVYGIFYVTNTSTHDVFRLDGFDGANYWSYIEFDTQSGKRGFWHDFNLGENTATNGTQNTNTDKLSFTTTQQGLLYIHDIPSMYNITDFPGINFDNDNAIVIRGLGTFSDSATPTTETESFSFSGSGDGYFADSGDSYPVITGKVTFKAKGPRNVP
jgi:hypothetical protein